MELHDRQSRRRIQRYVEPRPRQRGYCVRTELEDVDYLVVFVWAVTQGADVVLFECPGRRGFAVKDEVEAEGGEDGVVKGFGGRVGADAEGDVGEGVVVVALGLRLGGWGDGDGNGNGNC